jgi:hypothetical protein
MISRVPEEFSEKPLDRWLADVSGEGWIWYVKYLSANDTYAKRNVHQAGPYLSKLLLRSAFGDLSLRSQSEKNPDLRLPSSIDSHDWEGDVRVVWYNSRILEARSNGRDEARLTGWGGKDNPLVNADATGSLVVFAFYDGGTHADPSVLRIWIARSAQEADRILDAVGEVEPGAGVLWSPAGSAHQADPGRGSCELAVEDMPPQWIERFPSGEEIVEWVLANRDPWRRLDPDRRLFRRRACEYDVFRSIERQHVLPRIRDGFDTVDAFVEFSNGVTNRRKARAGRSLELQLRAIFDEQNVEYSWTPKTEGSRRPDFIFPSIERYRQSTWPSERLFMLAAKTTCKDRWRQILNEAERVPTKHLLTLQEGISQEQHREMVEEGVQLVVPSALLSAYPEEVRPSLMTVADFIEMVSEID